MRPPAGARWTRPGWASPHRGPAITPQVRFGSLVLPRSLAAAGRSGTQEMQERGAKAGQAVVRAVRAASRKAMCAGW